MIMWAQEICWEPENGLCRYNTSVGTPQLCAVYTQILLSKVECTTLSEYGIFMSICMVHIYIYMAHIYIIYIYIYIHHIYMMYI